MTHDDTIQYVLIAILAVIIGLMNYIKKNK